MDVEWKEMLRKGEIKRTHPFQGKFFSISFYSLLGKTMENIAL